MTAPSALRAALAALHARHRERHAFVAATAPTYPPIACDPTRCPERDFLDLLDAYDAALEAGMDGSVLRVLEAAQTLAAWFLKRNPALWDEPEARALIAAVGARGGYVRRAGGDPQRPFTDPQRPWGHSPHEEH